MAVNPLPTDPSDKPPMRDYWNKFRNRTDITIIAALTLVSILLFGTMEFVGITQLGLIGVVGITILSAVILSVTTIILIHIATKPFHDLLNEITRISDQSASLLPPETDNKQYERDGFADILQTVYDLAMRNKVHENATVETESLIAAALNETPTGIIIYNNSGEIVFKNRSAPVRTATDESTVLDVMFPEGDTHADWLAKVKQSQLNADEYRWTRVPDKLPGENNRRVFDIAANYNKNSAAQVILTFFDRTDTYMPEEDEFDFISFAAHELRGPITVIRGYLDVLYDELGPTMQKDQVELMQRLVVSSNRLSTYVNNILNAARFDRRHMKLRLSENTVLGIYKGVADDMELRASSQNRLLTIDIPDTLPTVASDNNSMSEVFSNLIDNGIKYSNEGGLVQVVARPIPGFVEVSVIDHGIGMPTNVMPNLFRKFYRSHRSRETVAGTGIGLYICKAIVSSHGGSITARSVENEGSTFSFTLPIYDTVAEKLKASDNSNQTLIGHGNGWIRNHTMYRG
ncbi:MAG: putative Histidine kinase [Candidatus Saccharibacteria bacterium]|nr:putative Histidine kinase [Candidatus Saccharibacteria bacterium]